MKLSRLRGRKTVDRVRSRGKKWQGKHMTITCLAVSGKLEVESGKLLVGTSASSKLHKSAVKRNRMRRRCREALRTSFSTFNFQLPTHVQLLISPRSSSLTCGFGELREDVEQFLKHLSQALSV